MLFGRPLVYITKSLGLEMQSLGLGLGLEIKVLVLILVLKKVLTTTLDLIDVIVEQANLPGT